MCKHFQIWYCCPQEAVFEVLIQQSLKTSRSKAPGSPWSPTRGDKRGYSDFLTAFCTELVYKALSKYQKMDSGIISDHA